MKQCPVCQNTYTDDSLQFCLADGATLFSGSSTTEVTQQFPGGTHPIRVNITEDTSPTILKPTLQPSMDPVEKKKGGWTLVIGLAGGFFAAAIVGVGIIAAIIWFQSREKNEVGTFEKPASNLTDSVNKTPTPTNDTENLREKIAELEKQIQEQKKDTTVPIIRAPEVAVTPKTSDQVVARVNSPGDGFLALRTAPSAETGDRILQIPHGSSVTVLACLPKAAGKKGRWCRVDYNGNTGWAYDGFLIY